jgi:dihydrofolate reductase/thymidylate synthase
MLDVDIIVAMDRMNGIAKNGKIPWHYPEDMKFLKKITTETPGTALIMGRLTYETIPEKFRPLKDRLNIVLTRNPLYTSDHENLIYMNDIDLALKLCKDKEDVKRVFIFGGADVYNQYIKYHTPRRIYATIINKNYECDKFFYFNRSHYDSCILGSSEDLDFYQLTAKGSPEELEYLSLFQKALSFGDSRGDRTGVGTKSLFAERLTFSLRDNVIPVMTTKKVFFKMLAKELLWFISGSTNTKELEEQGVNIWKGNTSLEFLRSHDPPLDYKEGDLGPGYGFQWRHAGAEYHGMNYDYTGKGVDQLQQMIDKLREKPTDRRILMSAWGVSDLDKMALPPCHMMLQLYVREGKYLSGQMYQRQ